MVSKRVDLDSLKNFVVDESDFFRSILKASILASEISDAYGFLDALDSASNHLEEDAPLYVILREIYDEVAKETVLKNVGVKRNNDASSP